MNIEIRALVTRALNADHLDTWHFDAIANPTGEILVSWNGDVIIQQVVIEGGHTATELFCKAVRFRAFERSPTVR
jgi:hypothetical protein